MNCEEESDVIDLDEYQPTAKRQRVPKTWVKADDIILSEVDEKDISSGGWLSDNVINACQNLLRRQYPHIGGLQSTVLATSRGVCADFECWGMSLGHYIHDWMSSFYSKSI